MSAKYKWEVLMSRPNPAGNVRMSSHRNYTRHGDAVRAMKGLHKRGYSAIIKSYYSDSPHRADPFSVSMCQTPRHNPFYEIQVATYYNLCAEIYDPYNALFECWEVAYALPENKRQADTFYELAA